MRIILNNFFKSALEVLKIIIFEWKGLLLSVLLGISTYYGYVSLFGISFLFTLVVNPILFVSIWQTNKIIKTIVQLKDYVEESTMDIKDYILENGNTFPKEDFLNSELMNKLILREIVDNEKSKIRVFLTTLYTLYISIAIYTIISFFLPLFNVIVLMTILFLLYLVFEYKERLKICLDICNGKPPKLVFKR